MKIFMPLKFLLVNTTILTIVMPISVCGKNNNAEAKEDDAVLPNAEQVLYP